MEVSSVERSFPTRRITSLAGQLGRPAFAVIAHAIFGRWQSNMAIFIDSYYFIDVLVQGDAIDLKVFPPSGDHANLKRELVYPDLHLFPNFKAHLLFCRIW